MSYGLTSVTRAYPALWKVNGSHAFDLDHELKLDACSPRLSELEDARDPYQQNNTTKLESVQKFASRAVTKRCREN